MELSNGYKQSEVGVIPKDWEMYQIKEIATYRRGSFPQPYGLSKWYDDTNGAPFIQVFDVDSNGKLKDETKRKISRLAQEQSVFAPKGTLVLTIQGSIGRMAVTHYDAFVDRTLLVFEDYKIPVDVTFFSLKIGVLFKKEEKYAPGGIIKTITKEALNSFYLSIPPTLAEQKAIATALSDMDVLISRLEKLIEKKRAIKQSMMQELLKPKEGWKLCILGDLVRFQVGFPLPSQYFNQNGIGFRIVKNRDLKADDQVFFYSEKFPREYLVQNGNVLIGMDGDFVLCHWDKGPAVLNQRVGRILKKKEISLRFLYYYLQSFLKEIENRTSSTTVKHLSHTDVEKIYLDLPMLEKQELIAQILGDMDSEIETLNGKLSKFQMLKQGMMQELLTGKTRLI